MRGASKCLPDVWRHNEKATAVLLSDQNSKFALTYFSPLYIGVPQTLALSSTAAPHPIPTSQITDILDCSIVG